MTRGRAIGVLLAADFLAAAGFPLVKAVALVHQRLLPAGGGWFMAADLAGPRFLLPIPLALWWHWRQGGERRLTAAEIRQGGAIGLFAAAGILILSDGLRITAASTGAFFATLYAVFVPVWFALRHRRMPHPGVWLSCALVLSGVAILGHFDWRHLRFGRGELECLLSALCFMGQLLSLDSKRFTGTRPAAITVAMFVAMSLVFAVVTVASAPNFESVLLPWTSPSWVALTLLLSLLATVGPCMMVNVAQPRVSATEAGLIYCVEPIFGALLCLCLPAWFSSWSGIPYPNETATLSLMTGGALITLANLLIQWVPRENPI